MKLGLILRCLVTAVACGSTVTAQAALVWDEAGNGDFSGDGLSPTALTVAIGSNSVIGSTGNSGTGVDLDYFKFTVPVGAALTSIMLLNNTFVSGGSSFFGIQAGPQLTVTPSGASGGGAENLLGFMHYSNDLIGTDILPALALGFSNGLPSGTYSVWVQETGGPVNYGFDFVMTPAVPEPSTTALLGIGMGIVGAAAWRRRRSA